MIPVFKSYGSIAETLARSGFFAMGTPSKGYLVRTKANSFKVLCGDCLKTSEFEEFVRPWSVLLSSRCVKCRRPVILNPEEPRPQESAKK
jgi:hypothetical protein